MSVTAHLVVQFPKNADGSGAGSSLSAEVDSRPDGLNNGVTTFQPGQTVAILVYTTGSAVVDELLTSAGTINPAGEVSIQVEEMVQFINSDEASLRREATIAGVVTWLGTNLGEVTFNGNRLKAEIKGVGVARVTYTTKAKVYALSSPALLGGLKTFEILVVVVGHDDN